MTAQKRRKVSLTRLAIALALAGLVWAGLYLARGVGESYLHSWIERQASVRLGAEVSLGELEIDLLPLAARAFDVEIASLDDSSLLASAETIEVAAAWTSLRRQPRRLQSLTAVGPRLKVVRHEDGTLNWPRFATGEGGAGVAIDRISVRDGTMDFADVSMPLDLELRHLVARASGASNTQFAGSLDASEATVGLPTGATYVGAVSLRGAWESGRLAVLNGRLSGPDLQATIERAELDLATKTWFVNFEAEGRAALLRRLGLGDRDIRGDWQFAGELAGDPDWRLAGRLSTRGVGWDDLTFARLDGDLAADPERLSVAGVEGRFTGGSVRADVEVGWADPRRPVRIEAELKDGSVQALLTKFDLDLPEVAGAWGGRGHYEFRVEEPLAGSGAADLTLRARDRAGSLAWRRRVPVDIDRGTVTFSLLTTDNEPERISASGSFDLESGQADVEYRVDTERVPTWMRLVGLGQEPEAAAWLPSSGAGSIEGSFHAMPGDWWSRLALDLQDVTIGELSPAAVRGPLSVSAEGVRDMRLEITQFEAAMLIAGAIETRSGSAPDFRLSVETSGWEAGELFSQLSLPPSLTGPLEGSARVRGTVDALQVTSALSVSPAEILGVPVDRVEADLSVEDGLLRVAAAGIDMPAGRVRLSGALPLGDGPLDLDFSVALADLSASPLDDALPDGTAGELIGHGSLGGTLANPTLTADLEANGLRVGSQDLSGAGTSRLNVRLAESQLAVDGTLGTLLTIGGGGELTRETADLALAIGSDRLDSLMAIGLPLVEPELAGSFRGVVRVVGSLADGLPDPEIQLDELRLRYAGHELEALEPVRATWRDHGLDVDSFFLGDDATQSEVFLFGRVSLADDAAIDLRGQVSLDTQWFVPLLPGWQVADGRFEALASVGGTLGRPEISGQGELRQPRLQVPGLPQTIRELEAVVLFYPDQIVIDGGQARFAGGRLRSAGNFDPFDPGGLKYRFQLAAKDVQLRYPEDWQVRGDAELVVASEPGGQVVRGQVGVQGALYTKDVPVGLTQLLQSAFSRRVELVEESDELLTSTRLNIVVKGEDALSIKNNVASLRGDLDFVIRGTLARPVIFGGVEVEPGGTLLYSGNSYDVRRASLKFANPYRIEPVIDLVAETRLAEYDLTLDLSGTLERLEVNFASDPPLADLQVLTLLAGGEAPPSGDLSGASQDSGGIAETFLYQQAASVVAARVNRLFGLDKFRIDPLTGDSGNISSARVTVGKRLGRDLFATYSYDPSQTGQQILELEWRISRELTLVATQNGDESYAVDLRWDRSF